MCSLPEIAELTLKQLTLRTVMLLALLTGNSRTHTKTVDRWNSAASCATDRTKGSRRASAQNRKHPYAPQRMCDCVLQQTQRKSGAHTEPEEISAFTPNPKISLVSHLHAYLKQTEPLRNGQELLVSFNKPHAPVARGAFSRWVKTMLSAAGVDTVHYGPHTTRAASFSAAANQGASLTFVLNAAGWSSEATFTRFYKKTVVDDPTFGHSVLRSFVQKHGI